MLFKRYIPFFCLGLFISFVAAFWSPELQKFYIKDNRVVENAGALLYLAAGLLSLYAVWQWKAKHFIPLFFALIGFVCALDEISWGREDLKFEPFKVMGVKIDALHDFSDVFLRVMAMYGDMFLFWLGSIVLIGTLLWLVLRNHQLILEFFAWERWKFFGLMVIFFFLSSANDLVHLDISKEAKLSLSVFEEYLELAAALALVFIALSLIRQGKIERGE